MVHTGEACSPEATYLAGRAHTWPAEELEWVVSGQSCCLAAFL